LAHGLWSGGIVCGANSGIRHRRGRIRRRKRSRCFSALVSVEQTCGASGLAAWNKRVEHRAATPVGGPRSGPPAGVALPNLVSLQTIRNALCRASETSGFAGDRNASISVPRRRASVSGVVFHTLSLPRGEQPPEARKNPTRS
jgi:hypothetical protein